MFYYICFNNATQVMNFEKKLEEVKAIAIARFNKSMNIELGAESIHGLEHWKKVEQNAILLSKQNGVDEEVVRLFAYLHDCRRQHDFEDLEHGYRASKFVIKLYKIGILSFLSDDRVKKLAEACEHHNTADVRELDPTIGACYDADRIELIRFGITPEPIFMSTEMGKWIAEKIKENEYNNVSFLRVNQ